MTEITTLHRCKHCGYLLKDIYDKYHPDCALEVERRLNNERQERYRKKYGNEHVIQWCKEHPEKRKKHLQNYTKKHRQELVEYNRNYRATHPNWYREQLQKSNETLHRRRHAHGCCSKCGRKANKSSRIGLCTSCLFKRTDEKYRRGIAKRYHSKIDHAKLKRQCLRKEFEHLIPDQLHEPWIDEYVSLVHSKVRLRIIKKDGEKISWTYDDVQRVWNAYKEQQLKYEAMRENQLTRLF